MRIPNAVHEAQGWVIADIAPDFDLLDVWALPVHGSREDFSRFVDCMASLDPTESSSAAAGALFWVRRRLGELFGWDDDTAQPIPGSTDTSLAARLPDHLRGSATAGAGGFTPLYRTDQEWAAEIANATVHGVLHLAWVEEAHGRYRAHLAVYVKTRGRLGRVYMALIQPFRHLVVYPALTRQIGRAWDRVTTEGS